ncbi:MAG: cell division protein FtsL [Mariprofundaceae bacterium]
MISRLHMGLLFIAFAILASSQVWLSHVRYEMNVDIGKLKKEQLLIKQDVQQLNIELASLTRPERLRIHAQNKLGMAPPKPMQVVHP